MAAAGGQMGVMKAVLAHVGPCGWSWGVQGLALVAQGLSKDMGWGVQQLPFMVLSKFVFGGI
jgi:hypothetical protein